MKFLSLFIVLTFVSCSSKDSKVSKEKVADISSEDSSSSLAIAQIQSPKDKVNGMVKIEETIKNVKFYVHVSGLKPNSKHGFHIHENGLCRGPDFKSAGGHLNPFNKSHGVPAKEESHLGDLGNLKANMQGVAQTEITVPKHHKSVMSEIIGKAFIIHAGVDDLKSQPSGDAGGRIACGVIESL